MVARSQILRRTPRAALSRLARRCPFSCLQTSGKQIEPPLTPDPLLIVSPSVTITQLGFEEKCYVPYTAKFRFIPKLRLQDGFVRAGGGLLKKDWFNANQSENRVYKNFDFTRLDRLHEDAERNADPWNWADFRKSANGQYFLNYLADGSRYEFYVRGRWEGVKGKKVVCERCEIREN